MTHCQEEVRSGCGCDGGTGHDCLREGLDLGWGFLHAIRHTAESILRTARDAEKKIGRALAGESCCRIPPPCWAPLCVGDVHSHVCPGGTATVRFQITNCGYREQAIHTSVVSKPADTPYVKTDPSDITLTPMERGWLNVSFKIPDNDPLRLDHELLVWVRGCRNYYLRWTVSAAHRGADSCHQICIEDCMDPVHHWYDHFYCNHPCNASR